MKRRFTAHLYKVPESKEVAVTLLSSCLDLLWIQFLVLSELPCNTQYQVARRKTCCQNVAFSAQRLRAHSCGSAKRSASPPALAFADMPMSLPCALALFQMPRPDVAEAQRVWRKMALAIHPDKGGDTAAFQVMSEACNIIIAAAGGAGAHGGGVAAPAEPSAAGEASSTASSSWGSASAPGYSASVAGS